MKKFQRMKQQASEALGRGEKSDKLTQKLAVVEKKVEGIRTGVQETTKKLRGTILGSGTSMEKHQRKLPQFTLGQCMMEHGSSLGNTSLFGSVLMMVGQAQQDIASQLATYEITVVQEIIATLNNMLEEDMKVVDKCKKKLGNARLDMDSARGRLRSFEQQIEKSTREYNMEKLTALKTEVDECTRKFEECQDAYATSMYEFISKEQEYTDKIQQLVKLQITNYKNAAIQLETMLPVFEKKMNETQDRPVFGLSLAEHLRISKRDIAAVLETCCSGLRKEWMDTEGLFRIAGGQAKVKFLKTSFDAGQFDVSTHDPHTIAGCLKMYLRELPEPLLTFPLYNEWLLAAGQSDPQTRMTRLNKVKEKLPEPNLTNFKYLCSFLHEFAQYSEITKMSVSNIAIVIGPNLLWPEEESTDPGHMVTETALQRCLTETFLDNINYFFPDLTDSASSTPKTSPPAPVTFTGSSSSSFSPTSLQSYTTKSSELFSPTAQHGVQSSNHHGTPPHKPTPPPPPVKEKEVELPHPLAESADDQGVKVLVDDKSSSPKPYQRNMSSPAPSSGDTSITKTRSLPRSGPPIPTPRTASSTNLTPPESPSFSHKTAPSPAPRARHGTASSTSSAGSGSGPGPVTRTPSGGELSLGSTGSGEGLRVPDSSQNGRGEEANEHAGTPPRPTPPVRAKRAAAANLSPAGPFKPPPYSPVVGGGGGGGGGSGSGTLERKATANARAPSRRAPPPPKARPKAIAPGSDESTSL